MFKWNGDSRMSLKRTLHSMGRFLTLLSLTLAVPACTPTKVSMQDRLAADGSNTFYVGNRAPLLPSPLIKLPVGAVEPKG